MATLRKESSTDEVEMQEIESELSHPSSPQPKTNVSLYLLEKAKEDFAEQLKRQRLANSIEKSAPILDQMHKVAKEEMNQAKFDAFISQDLQPLRELSESDEESFSKTQKILDDINNRLETGIPEHPSEIDIQINKIRKALNPENLDDGTESSKAFELALTAVLNRNDYKPLQQLAKSQMQQPSRAAKITGYALIGLGIFLALAAITAFALPGLGLPIAATVAGIMAANLGGTAGAIATVAGVATVLSTGAAGLGLFAKRAKESETSKEVNDLAKNMPETREETKQEISRIIANCSRN